MFGLELVRAREATGLSQSRLAAAAGFDHSYVSRLEANLRMPTRDAAARLADVLQLDAMARLRFMAAAGLTGDDPIWQALVTEPRLVEIARYLINPVVPEVKKAAVRKMLALIVADLPYERSEAA